MVIGSDDRQRGIFPLPRLVVDGRREFCVSRRSRQRCDRGVAWRSWANECIDSLNDLNGQRCGVQEVSAPDGAVNLPQRLALEHITESFQSFSWPSDLPVNSATSDAALEELLRRTPGYCEDDTKVRPYAKDSASWPAAGTTPTPLVNICSAAASARQGSWRTSMLVSESIAETRRQESGLAKPYVDPLLLGCLDRYADFLRRLDAAGMLRFRPRQHREQPSVGVFFVSKKDGSLRLVFDARIANLSFAEPAGTKLPTCSARASMEMAPEINGYMASADV